MTDPKNMPQQDNNTPLQQVDLQLIDPSQSNSLLNTGTFFTDIFKGIIKFLGGLGQSIKDGAAGLHPNRTWEKLQENPALVRERAEQFKNDMDAREAELKAAADDPSTPAEAEATADATDITDPENEQTASTSSPLEDNPDALKMASAAGRVEFNAVAPNYDPAEPPLTVAPTVNAPTFVA